MFNINFSFPYFLYSQESFPRLINGSFPRPMEVKHLLTLSCLGCRNETHQV